MRLIKNAKKKERDEVSISWSWFKICPFFHSVYLIIFDLIWFDSIEKWLHVTAFVHLTAISTAEQHIRVVFIDVQSCTAWHGIRVHMWSRSKNLTFLIKLQFSLAIRFRFQVFNIDSTFFTRNEDTIKWSCTSHFRDFHRITWKNAYFSTLTRWMQKFVSNSLSIRFDDGINKWKNSTLAEKKTIDCHRFLKISSI